MDTIREVQDESRLETLYKLQLLDSEREEVFDRLTRLASKIIGAPVSLVSLVDADRQFFKSFVGLGDPWASRRETPLSHSFCQYVVSTGEPLVVEDARNHPVLKDNLAIPDLGVIGYLGIPLQFSDGSNLGSFCVIDSEPRNWTKEEIEIVRELAMSVMTEIELRNQIQARKLAEAVVNKQNQQLRRVTEFCRSTLEQMDDALNHGSNLDEMQFYVKSAQTQLDRLTN